MKDHRVKLSTDHLQRQALCSGKTAIEELIWNALDAGGTSADVQFERNELGGVEAITISDSGAGIRFQDLDRAFGKIGESLKVGKFATPEGRAIHGREGRGRFKSLVLGRSARWETRFRDDSELKTYKIRISRDRQTLFQTDDEPQTLGSGSTGTTVRITGVDRAEKEYLSDAAIRGITQTLALYLAKYPDVVVRYDGNVLDVDPLISRISDYDIKIEDMASDLHLSIIEWNFKVPSKKILLCDLDGFSWHEVKAGIQARDMSFTAYLRFDQAQEWAQSGRFVSGDLDDEVRALLEQARSKLREHVREHLASEAKVLVKQWREEQIYPYEENEPASVIESAERQVFDIVASKVHQFHEPFRSGVTRSRRFTLQLVRQALETNPTSLKKILESVLALPKGQQDELADILESVTLPGMIVAAQAVRNRIRALDGFDEILFSKNWKAKLLERTQLHRLLVHHLWIFGEEYTLDSDDERLRAVLKKHLKYLGRDLLAEDKDPTLIDGGDGIPDLMLSRVFERGSEKIEHLVIELKRPKLRLGSNEITQIKGYAHAVASDERFSLTKVKWKFVVLGNDWDEFAEREANTKTLPYGCIGDYENYSVWMRRWSDVFHEARNRYKFFSRRLEVEASTDEGIRYLRENYAGLLEGRGLTKKQEMEKAGR